MKLPSFTYISVILCSFGLLTWMTPAHSEGDPDPGNSPKHNQKEEKECDENNPGQPSSSPVSSSFSISGGLAELLPNQSSPSSVGLRASNIAVAELKAADGNSMKREFPSGVSAFLATTKSLTPYGIGGEVIYSPNESVRQIKSKRTLIDVLEVENGYQIRTYKITDVSSEKNVEGIYTVNNGATPLYERKVSGNETGRKITYSDTSHYATVARQEELHIEQIPGQSENSCTLEQIWTNHNGKYKSSSTQLFLEEVDSLGLPVERYISTREEVGTDGVSYVVRRTAGTRVTYRWDKGAVDLTFCDAVDPDGNPLPESTSYEYTYYTDPTDGESYGKMKTMNRSDGYWEKYEYSGNLMTGTKVTKKYSPWLNAQDPGTISGQVNNVRIKEKIVLGSETGVYGETETVNGHVLSKYWVESVKEGENFIVEKRHVPHAGGTKITVTKRYCRDKNLVDSALLGRPVLITHQDGKIEKYSYDINGNILIVTLDKGIGSDSVINGTRTVSKIDTNNNTTTEQISYALQEGHAHWLESKTGIEFDNLGNCLKWVFNNDLTDYEEQRRDCCQITWERARNGDEIFYQYDQNGNVIETKFGNYSVYSDIKGLTTRIWKKDVSNGTIIFVNEEKKNLAGHVVESNKPSFNGEILTTTFIHDINNRSKKTINPIGTSHQKIYNCDNSLLKEIDAYGNEVLYSYTFVDQEISIRKSIGDFVEEEHFDNLKNITYRKHGSSEKHFTYDEAGRLSKTVNSDGEVKLFIYEGDDLIVCNDTNRNGIVDVAIDRVEKRIKTFDPTWPQGKGSWKNTTLNYIQGQEITTLITWMTHDENNVKEYSLGMTGFNYLNKPSISKRNGTYQIKYLRSNGWSVITNITQSGGGISTVSGQLLSSEGNILYQYIQNYDIWGHLVSYTSNNQTTAYVYDNYGFLLSKTVNGLIQNEYEYDLYGRLIKTLYGEGKTSNKSYDNNNNVIAEWGWQKIPIFSEYDNFGRKIKMVTSRSTDENAPNQENGEATQWRYCPISGSIVEKIFADGSSNSFTYTLEGKLSTIANGRGNIKNYYYDNIGRLQGTEVNDGITPAISYSYDQLDRAINIVTENVASYTYIYNAIGQLETEIVELQSDHSPSGLRRIINREYDQNGLLTKYSLLNNTIVEQSVRYQYDTADRIKYLYVDGSEFNYSFGDNHSLIPNTLVAPLHYSKITLDNKGNQFSRQNKWKHNDTAISSFELERNALGQPWKLETTYFNDSMGNRVWGYDSVGQLSQENDVIYSYDSAGNRISKTSMEYQANYESNSLNQYTYIDSQHLSYDNDGNATKKFLRNSEQYIDLVYNFDNKIFSYSNQDGNNSENAYDHMGRRVYHNGKLTVFDDFQEIAQYGSNNILEFTFGWGLDIYGTLRGVNNSGSLLMVTDHTRQIPLISYPTYDLNGSVSEYISSRNEGTIEKHYQYDAFGNIDIEIGETNYLHSFSTKVTDSNLGIIHYLYRDYDPQHGRWLSRDPIGEIDSPNLYVFLNNKPLMNIDILGLSGSYGPSSDASNLCIIGCHSSYQEPVPRLEDLKRCIEKCNNQAEEEASVSSAGETWSLLDQFDVHWQSSREVTTKQSVIKTWGIEGSIEAKVGAHAKGKFMGVISAGVSAEVGFGVKIGRNSHSEEEEIVKNTYAGPSEEDKINCYCIYGLKKNLIAKIGSTDVGSGDFWVKNRSKSTKTIKCAKDGCEDCQETMD